MIYIKIGIIDAELIYSKKHRFPNLACMKIAGYHKKIGDIVELLLSYDNLMQYDKVYISKVFTSTEIDNKISSFENVVYGGTGFFYDKAPPLLDEIEHHMPDYNLYRDWVDGQINSGKNRKEFEYYLDYSIGYTTRGCFRKCDFCVNKNSNRVIKHSPVNEFLDKSRKYICLLDDNILGSPNWEEIFNELIATGKKFQYKQGMDERVLVDKKCEMIFKKSKYIGDYIFAFDDIDDMDIVNRKAKLIRKYNKNKGQNIKFYVLCGFDKNGKYDDDFWIKDIIDTFRRIYLLSKYNFKPYIMRYEKYKDSPHYGTYVNLACWCNQPHLFNNLSYKDFCVKDDLRKSNGKGLSATWRYYEQIKDIDTIKDLLNIIPKSLNVDYEKL